MTAYRPMSLANAAHAARRAAEVEAERRIRFRLRWHLRHPKRRLLASYLAGADWSYGTYFNSPALTASVDGVALRFRVCVGGCIERTDTRSSGSIDRLEDLVPRR